MKYCFLQVSDRLLNPNDDNNPADKYFKAIWPNMDGEGYYRPEHYWEIPTWISELSYCLKDCALTIQHIIDESTELYDADIYFASVMDCNKEILARIVRANPDKSFYLGGYIGIEGFLETFRRTYHVCWHDSIEEVCDCLVLDYQYGTDYRLFKGMKCIPRLTLSNGCTNHCRFCTVSNKVIETDPIDIIQQIESLKDLDFELVYLNDKTFGQCPNYVELKYIYNSIKAFNPKFRGFTVQTTCDQINEWYADAVSLIDLFIVNVEIGVESYNDNILKKYRKPQSTGTISNAVWILKHIMDVNIIPNIIIGLPGENLYTYANTLKWLDDNKQDFLMLNVTNFVPYIGSEASDIVKTKPEDLNQTICQRSYHTEKEAIVVEVVTELLFDIGMEIIEATKKRSV